MRVFFLFSLLQFIFDNLGALALEALPLLNKSEFKEQNSMRCYICHNYLLWHYLINGHDVSIRVE